MSINYKGIRSITIAGSTQYGGDIEFNVPGATIDPSTGEIVIPTGGSGSIENFTLDATDISNKYVLVSTDVTIDRATKMSINGLGNLYFGTEFTVDGVNKKKIKWDSLSLDGVLVIGDEMEITYY